MSVAAALAEAHHSAPKVGAEAYNAPRSQRTASAGTRPGVLKDPEPQGAVTVGYVAAGAPSLSVVLVSDMMHDDVTVQFLLQQSLLARAQEEGEREKERERTYALYGWHYTPLSSSAVKRRKRKKRRKRRLPRSPRPLLRGRSRRRQRQWHARSAGFPGDVSPRACVPFVRRHV